MQWFEYAHGVGYRFESRSVSGRNKSLVLTVHCSGKVLGLFKFLW